MKLCYVLLLSLVAVVAADSYEHYQNSYPQEGESPSNYYTSRRGRPTKRAGFAERVKRFFGFGATRRQFAGTGTGTGTGTGSGTGFTTTSTGFTGPNNGGGQFVGRPTGGRFGGLLPGLLIGAAALVGLAALGGAIYLATQLNNSGRGLDTDEWEVDHSVWMDQLQKDFEDSWAEN